MSKFKAGDRVRVTGGERRDGNGYPFGTVLRLEEPNKIWVLDDEGDTLDWRERELALVPDVVNHPSHYTSHPSGVECITITEHMGFCLGNAVKYIWRASLKGEAKEDLEKAIWYLQRELKRVHGG